MIEFANDGEMLTVGKLLKNERERQELTLEEVSERTKINVKYLKAIEADSKEGFPGELYCELFTKSYAESLGLEYAKIRAGTFAAADSKSSSGKKSRKTEAAVADKAKDKKRFAPEKPKGPRFLPADTIDDEPATVALEKASSDEFVENGGAGKKDIIRYFVIIAAIVFSLLMVVVYISISSDKTESGESGGDRSKEMPAATYEDESAEPNVADNGLLPGNDDSFYVGPVQMYPDSLEVTLISTQESWASVIADSNTVFSSFFQPGKENLFRAAKELDITLGRWEFVTGKIYTHPMKEINSFHQQGRNSVNLLITKENWEAFIDSTKLDHDQN